MIWESHPWRKMLRKHVKFYKNFRFSEEIKDHDDFKIEKTVFIDAYAIRKLIEAKKLITKDEKSLVRLTALKKGNKRITLKNWYKIHELYNFDTAHQVTKTIPDVCHLIIHSFIFLPAAEKEKLDGFYFTSDKTKDKALYKITLEDWISLLTTVASSEPTCSLWCIDKDGNEVVENK